MFFDIIYNIAIYPVEFIIETLFYLFYNVFQSSYAVSLFLLSLSVNFLSLPLYNIAESWQAKERAIQDKMKPMIDNIKSVYKGDQRYLLIRTCQRINGYKTIYAFRGTLGLLIQVPFFIAAYNFIHNLSGVNFGSFLFIKDLSSPDALFKIGNFNINILPFIMTLFSLLSSFIYAKKLRFKESLPLYIVSLIFLVLLYNSPSGLLFYWTINCLFSLIKNVVIEYKLYNIFLTNKNKLLKAYNIFLFTVFISLVILALLAKIDRKAYLDDFDLIDSKNDIYVYHANLKYYNKVFRSSDIFGLNLNTDILLLDDIKKIIFIDSTINTKSVIIELYKKRENISENIDVYYDLYLKNYTINIFLFMLILFLFFNMNKIFNFILKNNSVLNLFLKNRNNLIIFSCLIISLLSGLFIPSSLIGSSPGEFNNPFHLIINNLSMSLGLFLFYPLFIYFLFSEKIKNYMALLSIFIMPIILINTFVIIGNYGHITPNFSFDSADKLLYSSKDVYISIFIILLTISILITIIKLKLSFIVNILYVILIGIFSVYIFNHYTIYKHNKENDKYISNDYSHFNFSKTGTNILVIILDAATGDRWNDALNMHPEYNEKFSGFELFPNTVSLAGPTLPSFPSLYGGYDYYPYKFYIEKTNNMTNWSRESLIMLPLALSKYDYTSSLMDLAYFTAFKPNYSNYNYINILSYDYNNIVSNFSKANNIKEDLVNIINNKKSIRFSIFRMLPICFRHFFYQDSRWFLPNLINLNNSIIEYYKLAEITNLININENGNYFNIVHNNITHVPLSFDTNYMPSLYFRNDIITKEYLELYNGDKNAIIDLYANISAMKIISDILLFLRKNNIYNNTKIIIASDHGGIGGWSTNRNSINYVPGFNSLLIYKDYNSSGNVKINTNFMTSADLAYLATKHIPNIKNPYNNKIITNNQKTNGIYIVDLYGYDRINNKYYNDLTFQFTNSYRFKAFYYVKDNIFDINNWKKFKMDWNDKQSKEVKLE